MATEALRKQVASKWHDSFNRFNHGSVGISGLISFSQAWAISRAYLRPKDLTDPTSSTTYTYAEFKAAFEVVHQCKRLPVLLEAFLEDVNAHFYLIEAEVSKFMAQFELSSNPEDIAHLIYRLQEWYTAWLPMSELGYTVLSTFKLSFQTHLFATLPPSFARGFKALCLSTLMNSSNSALSFTPDRGLWLAFETLGLVDRYESLIASVGYEHIEAHILETCTEKWAEPMLNELRTWMADIIMPWLLTTYAPGVKSKEEARVMLQGVGARFDFHMNKTLCDLRTREIFDIIIDFPDSMGALKDLKECLMRVDQRTQLVQALRKANKRRLLHPGADTKLILSQYVSTIKCLRIIDPPGVLLFKVADPIRRYLRDRPDTIRSIVANLVGDDDTGDSLVDENEPVQPLQLADVEDYADPNWEPEPIDAGPDFRANKSSDIISTLVSIYDSKDLFVKELQILLAQRLLVNQSDNVERERRNVEILKIRFGEAALQVCEVMLRDMTDSKRIDQQVQTQLESVVHTTIISKHFWPSLESSDLVMPGQFVELQERYSKEYVRYKPDKRLRWLPHLGTVELKLELADRVVEASVPPLEAGLIELFSENPIWSLSDLLPRVGKVDRSAALKALLTWVDLGVIKEDTENVFRLLETAEEITKAPAARLVPAVEEPPPVASLQQIQAEQMRVHWKFIEGMLTNLGQLPLDRIQTMLKFVPDYDRTMDQLSAFMEAAQREGLVTARDGMWKLKR